MITGKYIFKQNGEIIAEKENVITENGLSLINKYLCGAISSWAGTLAIGALENTSASTDTTLYYELNRTGITSKSYDAAAKKIIFKAQFKEDVVANIYEVGIFPINTTTSTLRSDSYLSDFNEKYGSSASLDWVTNSLNILPNTSSVVTRSQSSIPIATNTSASISLDQTKDLSQYANRKIDSLSLLYFVPASATTANASVRFILGDNTGKTWQTTLTSIPCSSSGFKTTSFALSSLPVTNFDYSIIKTIQINFSGGTANQIFLDTLKVLNGDQKGELDKLVSRTSSTNPIFKKVYGQKLDIEYQVSVT